MTELSDRDDVTRWAANPLGDRPVQIMDEVLNSMPITLISSSAVMCCTADQLATEVLADKRLLDFDHIPVLRDDDELIGVLERNRVAGKDVQSDTVVAEVVTTLTGRMLMSADASILDFVETADTQPFALIIEGRDLGGIVTLSDLQQLAVRPSLFSLVTLVEMLLAEWILLIDPDNEDWPSNLNPQQQASIRGRFEVLREKNLVVDMITATYFSEKVTAATQLPGFPGGPDARDELKNVSDLRNSIFHHHNFAEHPESAKQICHLVRVARKYVRLLAEDMGSR